MKQSHRMHDAIPTLQKIHALRESCAKCYFCQGGLKLLLTTVSSMLLVWFCCCFVCLFVVVVVFCFVFLNNFNLVLNNGSPKKLSITSKCQIIEMSNAGKLGVNWV